MEQCPPSVSVIFSHRAPTVHVCIPTQTHGYRCTWVWLLLLLACVEPVTKVELRSGDEPDGAPICLGSRCVFVEDAVDNVINVWSWGAVLSPASDRPG